LNIHIWRGRTHNTDGSTSWRSRIQFPLQRFSYFKEQLTITSTSTSSSSGPFLNLIQPSTMNEIELLASYSPIYKQLWTSIAKSNGCLFFFPNEEENNNDNNNDNNNNKIEEAKLILLVKVIYKDNNIDFSRRYHCKIITTVNPSAKIDSYLNIIRGLSIMYNKVPTIINNISDNYQ
jgi:hypothetical protein